MDKVFEELAMHGSKFAAITKVHYKSIVLYVTEPFIVCLDDIFKSVLKIKSIETSQMQVDICSEGTLCTSAKYRSVCNILSSVIFNWHLGFNSEFCLVPFMLIFQ